MDDLSEGPEEDSMFDFNPEKGKIMQSVVSINFVRVFLILFQERLLPYPDLICIKLCFLHQQPFALTVVALVLSSANSRQALTGSSF